MRRADLEKALGWCDNIVYEAECLQKRVQEMADESEDTISTDDLDEKVVDVDEQDLDISLSNGMDDVFMAMVHLCKERGIQKEFD
jgi:hypothetical protein